MRPAVAPRCGVGPSGAAGAAAAEAGEAGRAGAAGGDAWADDALAGDSGRTGTRPARVGAFLQWGSWIGGDRDGNPTVTAELTRQVPRIHADHLLHGYEAVATRLMAMLAARPRPGYSHSPDCHW